MSEAMYTVAEAASLTGISRQAVYKKLSTLDNPALTGLQGGKRYVSRAGLEWLKESVNPLAHELTKKAVNLSTENVNLSSKVDTLETTISSLQEELNQAKADLLAEQGKSSTLQATVDAQKAHIDSLKTALDREQSLHMASLQKALPAPRRGLFDWLKGRKGEE